MGLGLFLQLGTFGPRSSKPLQDLIQRSSSVHNSSFWHTDLTRHSQNCVVVHTLLTSSSIPSESLLDIDFNEHAAVSELEGPCHALKRAPHTAKIEVVVDYDHLLRSAITLRLQVSSNSALERLSIRVRVEVVRPSAISFVQGEDHSVGPKL